MQHKRFGRPSVPILERLEGKYSPEPNSGCWLWLGYVDEYGYGMIDHKRAHRLMFEKARGVRLTTDVVLRHKCDVRSCVNPDHLLSGTQADNVADMWSKGRNGKVGPTEPLSGKNHWNYKHGRRCKNA